MRSWSGGAAAPPLSLSWSITARLLICHMVIPPVFSDFYVHGPDRTATPPDLMMVAVFCTRLRMRRYDGYGWSRMLADVHGCWQTFTNGRRSVTGKERPVTNPQTSPKAGARRKFGEAILKLRLKSNPDMTIKEIARCSGWGPTTVSDVLHGKRFPKKEVARDIVTAFGGDFEEISPLWDSLSELVHHVVPVAPVGVQDTQLTVTVYQDNSEFYAAARQSIETATREIRATYIRQYPPSNVTSTEAAEYFATMLDWARQPGVRSVSRIFGVPTARELARRNFLDCLRQHLAETEPIKNYQARVYEYSALGDGLNMALFDQDVSFLAVSGHGPQNLTGMRIDDIRATALLITYFDQLLLGSEPLADYLDRIDTKG